jgi:hypothetical protein
VFALFAGVQVEAAFWALSDGVGEILQKRSAFGAAGDGAGSGHVHGARSEGVFSFWSGRRPLGLGLLGSATGVLVTALPIFAVGQKMPPQSVQLKVPHCPPLQAAAQELVWYFCFLTTEAWRHGEGDARAGAVNCLSDIRVLPFEGEKLGGTYGGS